MQPRRRPWRGRAGCSCRTISSASEQRLCLRPADLAETAGIGEALTRIGGAGALSMWGTARSYAEAWLEKEYPSIRERAKAEDAEIHWDDETGLRSDAQRGSGYASKGKTPVVRVSQRRESLSMISTVTNKGKVRWMTFEGGINTTLFIRFLGRLIRDSDRKIFLILDNLPVHHAKKVKAWLEKHEEAIEVFFLPSDSPELNPDECLNSDLKLAVTSRAPARAKGDLKKATLSHIKKLSKSPERIRIYFKHEPVRHAA